MKTMVINKTTEQVIIYDNVLEISTHGATSDGNEYEPVVQFVLTDGTATFHTDEWDWFLLKK